MSEVESVQDTSPLVVDTETVAALQLRIGMMEDQINAAAAKVNLLANMALTGTQGYVDALSIYQTRLDSYNALKARLRT